MKILSIAFKNINSLKGEHTIDFTGEQFNYNPLFAITGPTGSGKTTILDVISLALFCQVPRIGRISKRDIEDKGAILTKNQTEAYAEVRYECSRGRYISHWSISTARTGSLRDYEMELSQVEPFEALDLKKSEVPAENEKLIGLSYGQFIKSVVLAQGEFAKFLKAGKKERSALLEQITGTGIYRELGVRAYRKYKDENDAIEQQLKILEAEKEDLLPEERQKELNHALKSLTKEISKTETAFEQVKTNLRQRSELEVFQEKIGNTEKNLNEFKNKAQEFSETNGKTLENHENVQSFSGDLQTWKHKNELLDSLKKEQDQLLLKQKNQQQQKKDQLNKTGCFVHTQVTEKNSEEELQNFFEKVDVLQQNKSQLQQDYRGRLELFQREIEDLSIDYSAKELLNDSSKWKDFSRKSKQELQRAQQNFKRIPEDLTSEIEAAETQLKSIQSAQNDQRFIAKTTKDLTQVEKALKEIKDELKPLPEKIKTSGYQVELQDGELKNLRLQQKNKLMQAELETYRKQLKPGEACPLCGSEEHPFAAHQLEKGDDLELKISAKEEKLGASQNQLSKLKTQEEGLKKQEEKQEAACQQQHKELAAQKEDFAETYAGQFSVEETGWPLKIETQKKQIRLLHELDGLRQSVQKINRGEPIFNELQQILKNGSELGEKIKAVYKGKNLLQDVRKLETEWRDLRQAIGFNKEKLGEVAKKLEREEKVFKELKHSLFPKLKEKGFENIQKAEEALLPLAEYQSQKKQEGEIKDKIIGLTSEVNTLSQQRIAFQKALKTDLNVEQLQNQKDGIVAELEKMETEKQRNARLLKNDEELLKKTTEREERIGEQRQKNRRWEMLSKLIGDATGNSFNQFAQDMTLRHLLKLANKRLKELSERYRLEGAQEKDDSLVVADLDMGGQKRSVKTLSGGETFLMSLSLALALSDLASKNIQINSLFIDEGFGTLDPETLDQTLDTLERLQATSAKTIGIISHVESLKERIGTQIQLQRDGRGYSSLKVVSL